MTSLRRICSSGAELTRSRNVMFPKVRLLLSMPSPVPLRGSLLYEISPILHRKVALLRR